MRSSIGNIFLGTNIRFVRLIFSVSIKLEFAKTVKIPLTTSKDSRQNGNSLIKQEYSTLDRYRKSIQNSPTTMFLCKTATVATALLLTVLRLEMNCVNALSMPTSSTTSRRDVLAHATEVVAGATASSILACGAPLTAHAAEGYRDGPEGLKYLVTNEGSGPKPVRGQKIETSYTLWINGFPGEESGGKKAKQIDSSKKPFGDQPFKVRAGVSQVIRGWDLSLIDMKEGESRRLIIPPELGYGAKGVGPIPGGAQLYFEMTLTKVGPLEVCSDIAYAWSLVMHSCSFLYYNLLLTQ